ncbi:Neuropilin and tolloid-like protein [Ooceraea biroi]|uniref:Neuropilin and tolloid-like protein n=1 Tax=Ooceraea biroi TaxID=2015173 RepID=A0A026WYI1_OOCBI|nr:Neuropilin and tolloid-like protein [Ooceraea biroi]
MLVKLDFRDEFKLEDSPGCRFDFLEVRDGQHSFSNLLGNFCGPNFPPEITSKTRYLWLRFHSDENIEGKGFKAVWSMIPRPTYPGVPPDPEECILNMTGTQAIIKSDDVQNIRIRAEKEGLPLDCLWVIQVQEKWKIQLSFDSFKLQRPNECDANFVDIFREHTEIAHMKSHERNFCSSIAETVVVPFHIAYVRFYAEPKAMNSCFEAVMTAIRDKESGEKSCLENEYDCEDATCIAAELECNGKVNCRFRWDEDDAKCDVSFTLAFCPSPVSKSSLPAIYVIQFPDLAHFRRVLRLHSTAARPLPLASSHFLAASQTPSHFLTFS